MRAVLPAFARPLLAPFLPASVEPVWFTTVAEARAMVAGAEIAWVDFEPAALVAEVLTEAGPDLRWVSTIYAGLDAFPLDLLRERKIILTHGAGINAYAVAEFAVLAVLVGAKRFDEVVRAQGRREWLWQSPGKIELFQTRALIIGHGTIGTLIGNRLSPFGIEVTGVTRSGRGGTIKPDAWRSRLGEFDWVILAAPSTSATKALIGADELSAMRNTAWLINIARGDMIDEDALVAALEGGTIGGAFLDPTEPEPLPSEHRLWSTRNCIITMHLSGRGQTKMIPRAADLFLQNLAAFLEDSPMKNVADLHAGY